MRRRTATLSSSVSWSVPALGVTSVLQDFAAAFAKVCDALKG